MKFSRNSDRCLMACVRVSTWSFLPFSYSARTKHAVRAQVLLRYTKRSRRGNPLSHPWNQTQDSWFNERAALTNTKLPTTLFACLRLAEVAHIRDSWTHARTCKIDDNKYTARYATRENRSPSTALRAEAQFYTTIINTTTPFKTPP